MANIELRWGRSAAQAPAFPCDFAFFCFLIQHRGGPFERRLPRRRIVESQNTLGVAGRIGTVAGPQHARSSALFGKDGGNRR